MELTKRKLKRRRSSYGFKSEVQVANTLNLLPIGRFLRRVIIRSYIKANRLETVFDVCGVCGKVGIIDTHTIPYLTCGSGDCEDKILEEDRKIKIARRALENQQDEK